MNKQTINNYTEKTKKGEYKGFIDESSTYKTLPEKDEYLDYILKKFSKICDILYDIAKEYIKENTRS